MWLFNKASKEGGREPQLNCGYTYGDKPVILTDEKGKEIIIADRNGYIQNFPGILLEDTWKKKLEGDHIPPRICYRTEFNSCPDGTWRMLWEVQPDGRYWEDEDGFGGSSDEEIILYSYFDCTGTFLAPFSAYRVGIKRYCEE